MYCIACGAPNSEQEKFCQRCGKPLVTSTTAAQAVAASRFIPLAAGRQRATIGDIAVTEDSVITPNGSGPLRDAQWIFTDMSRTETKIPTVSIVLAIVFALFCLIGLLFLLMKEKVTSGYVEISVRVGDIFHKTQIPVNSQSRIDDLRRLFNTVQSMSANARLTKEAPN